MKKLFLLTVLFFSALFSTEITVADTPDITPQELTTPPQSIEMQYQKTFAKTVSIILVSLGGVFVLMLLVKRFSYIRFSGGNQNSHIKIIERRPLSPKSMLYLVQIGDQTMVIGESQLELRRISELSAINSAKKP